MSLDWMDTSQLSFNHSLLLEKVQISWMPGVPEQEMAMALQANPIVAWRQRSHFQMNISILQWAGTFSEMRLLPNYKNWNELHVLAGQVILCPGNPDVDNAAHQVLVEHKYSRARFEEPKTGIMRKYWKVLE